MSYIEVCSKVAQVVFDLLIHLFGTRRIPMTVEPGTLFRTLS